MNREGFIDPEFIDDTPGEGVTPGTTPSHSESSDGTDSPSQPPSFNGTFVPLSSVVERAPRRPAGDKIELVRFDGTAITTSGKEVTHNWFKGLELDKDRYRDILLTAEEAKKLHAAHTRMKIGAATAAVMTCYGEKLCPLAQTCPYVKLQSEIDASGEKRNIVPLLQQCPLEQDMLFDAVKNYADAFGVGSLPEDYTDQRIILELAECDVLEHRMNAVLATKYQDLSEEKVVAVISDEHGEREQRIKDVADALKVKEKLWLRREKLRKNLVATRFDQYKRDAALQTNVELDTSKIQSELMARLRRLEALGIDD